MATLFAIFTFVLVTALFVPVWLYLAKDSRTDLVRRRLDAVQKAEGRNHTSAELKLIRDELLSDVPPLHRLLVRWSWASRFRGFLAQAGLRSKPGTILLLSGVLGLAAYLGTRIFVHPLFLAILAACVGAGIPFAAVAIKRRLRFRAFENHFTAALDLLSRAVRAGHAFSTGLEMIGSELPEPVAGEFRATFEEQNFGLPFRDALVNLCERVPLIDVRLFVTAVLIQRETGGNLAEILDTLARVIRDRFRIRREVRTRTAQGRLSAAILIALPPLMMVVLGILNPNYIRLLFTDVWGPYMLGIGALLQVVGGAVIWKIVNFEV